MPWKSACRQRSMFPPSTAKEPVSLFGVVKYNGNMGFRARVFIRLRLRFFPLRHRRGIFVVLYPKKTGDVVRTQMTATVFLGWRFSGWSIANDTANYSAIGRFGYPKGKKTLFDPKVSSAIHRYLSVKRRQHAFAPTIEIDYGAVGASRIRVENGGLHSIQAFCLDHGPAGE